MMQRSLSFSGVLAFGVMMVAPVQAATWTTTKVTEGPSGPYCAISRSLDGTMLTVGRTRAGASSLALEIPGAALDPKRTYTVTMKAGSNNPLDIETKPINDKTLVLNVDRMVDLPAAFRDSPTLQVQYDGKSKALVLYDWDTAADELAQCLSSFDAPSVAKAPAPVKPKIDAKPVASPVPLDGRGRVAELLDENRKLREENMVLRATPAPVPESRADVVDPATRDRLAQLVRENETLQKQLTAAQVATRAPVVPPAAAAEKTALQAERDRLAQENIDLQKKLAANAANITSAKVFGEEIAKLKVERDTLQAKLDAAMKKNADAVKTSKKTDGPSVAVLQQRIDFLEAERDDLKNQLVARDGAAHDGGVMDLQQRIDLLASENLRLRADLQKMKTNPADMKIDVAAEIPLRQQLRDRQAENKALSDRVAELQKQLDIVLNKGEQNLIAASGKNWDLEQATRRLQESEREVQRLSIAMRDQRNACEAEKKQIEYMLFDPKLAKEGQIALLNSLEDEIAQLRAGAPVPAPQTVVAVAPPAPVVADLTPPATVPPLEAVTSEPMAAAPVAPEPVDPPSAASMTQLLRQAGVALSETLTPVKKNPFGPGKAWSYESADLMGLAVVQAPVRPDAFDDTVQDRIKKLNRVCRGTFAAQPAVEQTIMNLKYAAFDAACIAGDNSTSAALLFYQRAGQFYVMSLESSPEAMDRAMTARDKIIKALVERAM